MLISAKLLDLHSRHHHSGPSNWLGKCGETEIGWPQSVARVVPRIIRRLMSMDTMEILTTSQYSNLKNAPKAIPTMCLLTVKTDKNNRPVQAKSRIVVLGNLEEREWTRPECYASILCQDSLCLLVSLAVQQERRVLKQGDCKNTSVSLLFATNNSSL